MRDALGFRSRVKKSEQSVSRFEVVRSGWKMS
jgi:hypothetical protein